MLSEEKFMRLLKQDFMLFWVGALLYMLGFSVSLGGFEVLFLGLGGCMIAFIGVDVLRLSTKAPSE